jgi:hypothetical protein
MNVSPDSFARSPDRPEGPVREESLLQAHLSRELDPQLGQARRRFEQMLAAGPGAAGSSSMRLDARGAAPSTHWRWIIGAVTAAAACLAFGVSFFYGLDWGDGGPGVMVQNTSPDSPLQAVGYTPLEYRESWQARDLGTYELNGKPVRAVHRQQWETARYRNDEGYEVTIEVPREQLVLVDAPVQ